MSNLTYQIRAGEHVAIIGASGSGKSTLARLLARAVKAGKVLAIRLSVWTVEKIEAEAAITQRDRAYQFLF